MESQIDFEYSKQFVRMIENLHMGKKNLPFYRKYIISHLGGAGSRYRRFILQLLPEIIYRCGELKGKRILDFGCGTGSTTVALANAGQEVFAYDIDDESLKICARRIHEHGLSNKVKFLRGDFGKVRNDIGLFDLILMNGVIEHIPKSIKGLRRRVLREVFRTLQERGFLYINETPNRLFPCDLHTTKLWWLPWTCPGSVWAYNRAIRKKRHTDVTNTDKQSPGPLGLEERGVWGATYFEIIGYFSGLSFKVMNNREGYDRHIDYQKIQKASVKRAMFEATVYYSATKWFGVPITAFSPSISHLVIQKTH
ncbi:MAG: class I SAM-dependent methyltransferase [Deltaproteobacteria bacterium]|nr:class I SAM-dependent methyltransferase [Deltaproteobacteria bacterium]